MWLEWREKGRMAHVEAEEVGEGQLTHGLGITILFKV